MNILESWFYYSRNKCRTLARFVRFAIRVRKNIRVYIKLNTNLPNIHF